MIIVKALVLPPGFQLLLALSGFILIWRWRRTGAGLIVIAIVSLYLFSIVPVAKSLLLGLEVHPPLSDVVEAGDRRAIVVLGGGRYPDAPEYGGDSAGPDTLERLRYAARLGEKTGLPILVSGGAPHGETVPEAVIMNRVLERSFHASAGWIESRSPNTAKSAEYSAAMLQAEGINDIFLVTHASHMRRSLEAFERAGMNVTPAPTGYLMYRLDQRRLPWFVPSIGALNGSHRALYEYYGLLWYSLRY